MSWVNVAEGFSLAALRTRGCRAHFCINDRYVTVVEHNLTKRLFCIDSSCCHAAGPLGEGPIEDIEEIPCIRCPWHNFLFSLDTGERVLQQILISKSMPNGVYTPPSQMQFPLREWPKDCLGSASRGGNMVQRVHPVQIVKSFAFRLSVNLDDDDDFGHANKVGASGGSEASVTVLSGMDGASLSRVMIEEAESWIVQVDVLGLREQSCLVPSDIPSCDERGSLSLKIGLNRLERELAEKTATIEFKQSIRAVDSDAVIPSTRIPRRLTGDCTLTADSEPAGGKQVIGKETLLNEADKNKVPSHNVCVSTGRLQSPNSMNKREVMLMNDSEVSCSSDDGGPPNPLAATPPPSPCIFTI